MKGTLAHILLGLLLSTLLASCTASPPTTAVTPTTVTPPIAPPAPPTAAAVSAAALDYKNLYFEKIVMPQAGWSNVVEDREGFLWMASEVMVLRYDGYEFKKYDKRLPSVVAAIYEDRAGVLWFGSSGELDAYDKNTDTVTTYTPAPQKPDALPGGFLAPQTITEDDAGDLWFGTDEGLSRFDRQSQTFQTYRANAGDAGALLDKHVRSVQRSASGKLWVGTVTGLHLFDPATGRVVERYPGAADLSPETLHAANIYALWEAADGTLWIGSEGNGLDHFDPRARTFTHYLHDPDNSASISSNRVLALLMTPETPNLVWVGTYDTGLNLLDTAAGEVTRYVYDASNTAPGALPNNSLRSLFRDRTGVIWLLDVTGQISRIDPGAQRFRAYRNDPNDPTSIGLGNSVCATALDRQGNLWIAVANVQLDRYDYRTGVFTHFRPDPADPAALPAEPHHTLVADADGTLWFTTNGWMVHFDPITTRVLQKWPLPTGISYINGLTDRLNPDNIWLGSQDRGLFKFTKSTGAVKNFIPDAADPGAIAGSWVFPLLNSQDETGAFWLDVLGYGVQKFDPRAEKVVASYTSNPSDPTTLASNQVTHYYRDSKGRIWFNHAQQGPDLFDPVAGTFQRFADKYGADWPATGGGQTLEDRQGHLWIGGVVVGEVVRFNPDTGQLRLYAAADGIPETIACGYGSPQQTADGRFWLFGIVGAVSFDPAAVQDNPNRPPVRFTALTQSGQPLDLGLAVEKAKAITLDWQNNFFEFQVAALSYRHPEKNQYQYKLEGWDKDWYLAGTDRQGRYSGLAAGEYTLRVRGSNDDGVWSDQEATLNITVVPPFWATGWFRGLALLIVVGGAVGGVAWRIRGIQQQKLHLEKLVAERTAELRGSETRYRQLVDDAPIAIAVHQQGKVVFVNPAAIHLVGAKEAEDVVGKPMLDFVHPDYRGLALQRARAVLAGDTALLAEEKFLRLDGSVIDVEVTTTLITYAGRSAAQVIIRDISERKRVEELLRSLSLTDDLTGLYNRRGFIALAEQQLKQAHRKRQRVLLLFFDMDRLKEINDTLGHHKGDQALQEAAVVIKETFRESDTLARLGGDEFAVLAIAAPEDSAELLAARLQENLAARNARGDQLYQLSFSIGAARCDPGQTCSVDELLAEADALMYEDKQRKRL